MPTLSNKMLSSSLSLATIISVEQICRANCHSVLDDCLPFIITLPINTRFGEVTTSAKVHQSVTVDGGIASDGLFGGVVAC